VTSSFTSASLPGGDATLVPSQLTFSSTNKVVVTLPVENADKFSASLNTTGSFKGSFTLQDKRKVSVEGVLVKQTTVTSDTVIGEGFFIIPSLTKGAESVSGKVQFVAP